MKMKLFDKWLDDITPHGDNNVSRYVKVVEDQGQSEEGKGKYEFKKRVRLYTDNHVYAIVAIDRGHNDGYLGCVCSLRKPYVGEDHTRGNDLPDGPFNIETWENIKSAIIARELEPLFIPPLVENLPTKETGPSLGEGCDIPCDCDCTGGD